MAKIAPAYINGLIDTLLRGDTTGEIGYLPATLYLALLIAEPYPIYDQYLAFDTEDEVTYTGYARQSIARSLTGFRSTQGNTSASSGTTGTTSPAANQYFPLCTTSSEIVTHAALCVDNVRVSVENYVVCYWTLPRPMQLSNTSPGFYPCLFASALTIQLDD